VSPVFLVRVVKTCMCKTTRDPAKLRLFVALDSAHRDLESSVLRALEAVGGKIQYAMASRGALERSIATTLVGMCEFSPDR